MRLRMSSTTPDLFGPVLSVPAGSDYRPGIITAEHEHELLNEFAKLPFEPFAFTATRVSDDA